jgi:hypothetical protein
MLGRFAPLLFLRAFHRRAHAPQRRIPPSTSISVFSFFLLTWTAREVDKEREGGDESERSIEPFIEIESFSPLFLFGASCSFNR